MKKNGMRYSTIELDSAAYDYITGGNSSYNFKASNMHMPAVKTLKHHISGYTMDTKEGVVMVQPLLFDLTSIPDGCDFERRWDCIISQHRVRP